MQRRRSAPEDFWPRTNGTFGMRIKRQRPNWLIRLARSASSLGKCATADRISHGCPTFASGIDSWMNKIILSGGGANSLTPDHHFTEVNRRIGNRRRDRHPPLPDLNHSQWLSSLQTAKYLRFYLGTGIAVTRLGSSASSDALQSWQLIPGRLSAYFGSGRGWIADPGVGFPV